MKLCSDMDSVMIFSVAYTQQTSLYYFRRIYTMWFLPHLFCRHDIPSKKFLVPNKFTWQIAWETAINNGLKLCRKRDLSAYCDVGLFLLYFFNLSCFDQLILCELVSNFESFWHVPIWALPILGTHQYALDTTLIIL